MYWSRPRTYCKSQSKSSVSSETDGEEDPILIDDKEFRWGEILRQRIVNHMWKNY